MDDRTVRILDFIEIADGLKTTYRAGYLHDHSRFESTAEHVWHTCLMAMLFFDRVEGEVDLLHTLEVLVVHDLVEIYAGDVALHDEEARKHQAEAEQKAADELFPKLPDDLAERFRTLWEEFEANETPEARYARELDRLQAVIQNITAKGRAWKDYAVTEADARRRISRTMKFDRQLQDVFEHLYDRATSQGFWADPPDGGS